MADVVVIGAGVIGLTCALRALETVAEVTVVTAALPADTTSAVAAAVWYPVGLEGGDGVAEWSLRTYDVFAQQAADGVPGVVMRPNRMLTSELDAPVPWWARGLPDFARLGTSGPDQQAPAGPPTAGWTFTAPSVEMPVYLDWLLDRFRRLGGALLHRRLNSLHEIPAWAPVVVNATGLGARWLCGDESVHPVRGQVVLVRNPGLRTSLRVQGHPGGYTYIHPRSTDVVLGGTFEEGNWETAPDRETARAILRRCTQLVPELGDAEVIGHKVGLRPARYGGVRLEADDRTLPGTRLIHNYGHGGAGMTLSWGCAEAAAGLITAAVA